MKKVTDITMLMENMEEIALLPEEIEDLHLEDICEQVVCLNGGMLKTKAANGVTLKLKVQANHTYNAFGMPSVQSIFRRLMEEDNPVVLFRLEYDDGTGDEIFIPGDIQQEFILDPHGNLAMLALRDKDEEEEFNCCCGDCPCEE